MKSVVYVETSVISYMTARPSRDLVVAAHQQTTRDWWGGARDAYELVVSTVVLEEISRGDVDAAAARLALVRDLPVLAVDSLVRDLAIEYQRLLQIPADAEPDLYHIALSVRYETDYLVTWNCSHIANVRSARLISVRNVERGRFMPLIVTPDWFEVQS